MPCDRASTMAVVMRGLDPRIHPSSQEAFREEDGLPGQTRQRRPGVAPPPLSCFPPSGSRRETPSSRSPRGFLTRCIQRSADLLWCERATSFQPGAREIVMAKGQMRSNKEKKKPKADKNLKKGGAAPVNPFAAGKTPAGQSPNNKKS